MIDKSTNLQDLPPRLVAIISVRASSLIGFRGPLIQALVAQGVRVIALGSDYDADTREAVRALGAEPVDISLSRTGMNPIADVRDCYRLSLVLRRFKPDVSLGYYIKPVIYGTAAAWLADVPHRVAMIEGLGFVFTDDGHPASLKKRALRWMVSRLYRFALQKAHSVVFLNPDDIHDFVRWRICDVNKAFELGGIGVDLQEWQSKVPVTDPVRFLFIGRLLREKGIQDFVAAARIIKSRYPSAQFVLLGDVDTNPGGIRAEQMRDWVNDGLLIWPGHVPVQPWLEQTSVFVLPSYREGVPRSSQEAMAMGRPIITTDVPGCRQTVEHGVNGFLVPVRDAAALAEAMLRFIEEPELIALMGLESRRLAEERFDVHKANAKLMGVLGMGEHVIAKDEATF